MTRFFDPLSQSMRELHTDIGRSLARRLEGEPAPAVVLAPTPADMPMIQRDSPTPEAQPDADGWIEHDGKGMPVDGETLVLVRFRTPPQGTLTLRAAYWHSYNPRTSNWVHDGCDNDIVAYKLAEVTR